MWFKLFKHKKKEEETSRTFDGKFISDDEINEMIKPKKGTFIKKEFEEINEMLKNIKEQIDGDGRE